VIVSAAFEAPAVIAGFNNIAVMSEAIEQRRGHLGVAEYARPFTEGEIGGDDDRGALIETADEVEQELAAGLGERQIAEFIEDDELHAGQLIGEPSLPAASGVRRDKAAFSSGCKSHPATAPAGSNRSSYGGNEIAEAFGMRVTIYGDSASVQAVTRVNAEQASKRPMRRPTRQPFRGRLIRLGE
jgi:hypothetical protein